MSDVNNFYLNKAEPNKSCLLALRDIVKSCDPNISETIKYGMPCFVFNGKVFIYLMVEKKSNQPYLLFCEGRKLDYPDLEMGDRKRMKIFRVDPNADIPIERIQFLIKKAIDLFR
jgi:hypothetical protein|tara:strand:- start:20982 stop:21326 length:345 start_codon:yes stop_codon:yes gene_type:complete